MSLHRTAQISPEVMRQEVGRVLMAREKLAYFSEYIGDGWYTAYKMHHLMAKELEDVLLFLQSDGKQGTQFLIILTAPQHGKSTLTSQFFPAFALGKLPDLRLTLISYGEALASKHSRAARNIVASSRYQAVFGEFSPSQLPDIDESVQLSTDSKSVTAWDLAAPRRGGMIAAGIGGAISGQPKGLFIWDDPIKDHREAAKKEVRDDVWDFYLSSMRVRMTACVLVMTHWHPDDPAGRLLKQMVTNPEAGTWKVLDLPGMVEPGLFARNEAEQRKKMRDGVYMALKDPLDRQPGEVLCPKILSKSEMLKIKAADIYFFTALFQQRPYPKEGRRYKREWIKKVKSLPEGVKIVLVLRYWDKAGSEDGDYTAGVLMAYCSDKLFYILDVVRDRWTTFDRNQAMRETAKNDKARYGVVLIYHQQDPGSAGIDSALNTNRALSGFSAFYEPLSGSKETRSGPLESGFQGKLVYLVEGDWNEEFIDELCAFPHGTYDDQVDAASSAYSKLCEIRDLMDEQDDQEEVVVFEERVVISPV